MNRKAGGGAGRGRSSSCSLVGYYAKYERARYSYLSTMKSNQSRWVHGGSHIFRVHERMVTRLRHGAMECQYMLCSGYVISRNDCKCKEQVISYSKDLKLLFCITCTVFFLCAFGSVQRSFAPQQVRRRDDMDIRDRHTPRDGKLIESSSIYATCWQHN